ncbi:MAG: carbamoyltransferase HypF [Burkholderiaceae bacterium]|jgi:hydrogenase maturation protein HypF|nr:carbamoyltransferase HypF [Burkholderiaceae bacterium]
MTASVLAFGAWLKNAACWWHGGCAHWSPLHGDLSDPDACAALEQSAGQLLAQAQQSGAPVQAIAHDLHPDFFSTQLALTMADALGVPAIGVQHHHAHLAAVVTEHRIEGPVVGLALDGVGLGTDGAPWGGELLWLDGPRWSRLGHLYPLALPGGDRAAREPWRMAASVLHALGRTGDIGPRFGPLVGQTQADGVRQMLTRGLNCPHTTSTGRWFDAAAAALGLSLRQQDEAEAAMALEQAAARAVQTPPALPGVVIDDANRLDPRALLAALFDAGDVAQAAAGFHLALADGLADWLIAAARDRQTRIACLGGGCFFNRILRARVLARLSQAGLQAYLPGAMGCGDAGLAVGQAWVAAHAVRRSCALPLAGAEEIPFSFTLDNPLPEETAPCA